MPSVEIVNNVVKLRVEVKDYNTILEMSLQRHHYLYCSSAVALEQNSLMYYSVSLENVKKDAYSVGQKIEEKLNDQDDIIWKNVYGMRVVARSGRTYYIDNVAQNPDLMVNHFFPIKGSNLCEQMEQGLYIACREIRRVEEVLARKSVFDQEEYKKVAKVSKLISNKSYNWKLENPVLKKYVEASTEMGIFKPDKFDLEKMVQVSGQPGIVAVINALVTRSV